MQFRIRGVPPAVLLGVRGFLVLIGCFLADFAVRFLAVLVDMTFRPSNR
jgi:hypothetical protein